MSMNFTKFLPTRYVEMDKKRWLVRYLILAALGTILSFKVYITLFIIDRTVGLYGIITTTVLFSYFFLSYVKFKDPYDEARNNSSSDKPIVSIIIPVKNEENFIRNCVQAALDSTYLHKEIIVVDDGSTDKTGQILDEMSRETNIRVVHNSISSGKKRAIEIGADIANGEIYLFTDSDCSIAPDAVEKAVAILMSDNKIGSVTGHGRIRRDPSSKWNALEKMQDVWYDSQYRIYKGAESSFSTMSCCSGPFTAYRKAAVKPFLHAWVHDKFFGQEFKFATDRRLTAFVLGARGTETSNDFGVIGTKKSSEESTFAWRMVYSLSIRVFVGTPNTIRPLIRQQIRWRKSFIRSIFSTGKVFWKRPAPIALLFYLQMSLKIVRPFIILKSLIILPLMGDYVTAVLYFTSVCFTSTIYAIDFRLRNPGNKIWLYRPLMTMLSMFVFSWLVFYALLTIRKTHWR